VDPLGQLNQYSAYNDIWGYTDGLGREYALLGTNTGTSVVNVSDPAAAYETGFISGPSSIWRDIKTYGNTAYVVTEGGGGMQIIDLTDPESPSLVNTYGGFSSAHNLYIEEASARAYPCGTNVAQGFLVLDLSNPTAPVSLGTYTDTYVHDLYVRDDIAYIAQINAGTFSILDVSNPAAPILLGGPITYPTAFTHNTWLTKDGSYLLTTDENVGGRVRIWDIQNLLNIQQVAEFQAPVTSSIVHNVLVQDNTAYISYYTEGLRVVDLTDPTNPAEIGYYDTWPGASGSFDGAWGVYPFLSSGHVLVSDISTGLYVFGVNSPGARLQGTVADASANPVSGAQVELVEAAASTQTSATGSYALYAAEGMYTLRVSAEGYYDHEETVTLQDCCPLTVDVTLDAKPTAPLSGTVSGEDGNKVLVALASATVELLGTSQQTVTDANGDYTLPLVPVGSYTLRVVRPGYGFADLLVEVQEPGTAQDVNLDVSPWYDNADADTGWLLSAVGDDATTGLWVRDLPVPSGGGTVQPGVDASPQPSSGVCFVTGNAQNPGDSIGVSDVDGGTTTLTTPLLALGSIADPYVGYSRWYVNAAGANPGTDLWQIQISNDDGQSWVDLEVLDFDATPWTRVFFRVSDYVTPTDLVRLRFLAADTGGGSVVECAVDDLEFFGKSATAVDPTPSPPHPVQLTSYPNPFNPRTVVHFALSHAQRILLTIHDVRGRKVATLAEGMHPAGDHDVRWDGVDAFGHAVASGAYFAVLRTEDRSLTRKLLLAK
jgi:choice-of-anchor B domain-containing protein